MADNRNDIPMGWDDEIENDGEGYKVLPEGEYDFIVEDFSRARYDGEATQKPCPMAELKLRVRGEQESGIVQDTIILNRKFEWKMCAFFTAIGARKRGETLRPNWNAVKGTKGCCKITVAKHTSRKSGKEYDINNVTYLEPEDTEGALEAPVYQPAQSDSGYTQKPLTSADQPRRWVPGSFGN